MSFLLKIVRNCSLTQTTASTRQISTLLTKNTLLDQTTTCPNNKHALLTRNDLISTPNKRLMYTFRLSNKIVRNTHATRPRKTKNNSTDLTYEQSQFAEKLGITKSWNSWNTSNLLEGKRQAENSIEDFTLRKFIYGTFHGALASEIIIKRRFNTIDISFLSRLPKGFQSQKIYFLVGYSETILAALFKCVVKINVQTIKNNKDLIFRTW